MRKLFGIILTVLGCYFLFLFLIRLPIPWSMDGALQDYEAEARAQMRTNIGWSALGDMRYSLDKEHNLAQMSYKLDDEPGWKTAYFVIDGGKIYMLHTKELNQEMLRAFAQQEPLYFRQNIEAYCAIEAVKEKNARVFKEYRLQLDEVADGNHSNSFYWEQLQKDSHELNRRLKEVREVYDAASPLVRQYCELPFKGYVVVEWYCSLYSTSCEGKYYFQENYPEEY